MEDYVNIKPEFAGPDTFFFGVFDGHNGGGVAELCSAVMHEEISRRIIDGVGPQDAIRESFATVHARSCELDPKQGSTAGVCIILKDTVYVANVGDTRIVVKSPTVGLVRMSVDHRVSDPNERDEIVNRGGFVFQQRVNGYLLVTRAIGDLHVGDCMCAEPYIAQCALEPGMKIIIASDGVWDVLSDEDAMAIFENSENCELATTAIEMEVDSQGGQDNVSIVCVSCESPRD
jgi:serine/threonine protein phosphatase PrpC